jgi:hypothetical protein
MADSDMDIIEDCTLSGVTIRKTTSKKCVLRYVEVYTSSISSTTPRKSGSYKPPMIPPAP